MIVDYFWLFLAAALGGAVNSVAGGGTLLTFPALFAALGATAQAAVVANATSTVALVPAAVGAAWGYRRELSGVRRWALLLLGPSLLGGVVGSLLVTELPANVFESLVPWLILAAALLFAAQPAAARWIGLRQRSASSANSLPTPAMRLPVAIFQLMIAIYGGYFGAGLGILMLCGLAFLVPGDIHVMNALKAVLGGSINAVAVVVFIATGNVNWPLAILMATAAVAGGYLGARVARRLDPRLVRRIVVVIGFSLAAYYFYRQSFA